MSKKRSLLSLLGAGLVGFTSLFSGNDVKAQTAETIKFGTYSPDADGYVLNLEHKSGSQEGFISGEDTFLSIPPNINPYILPSHTLVEGNVLGKDSRPINSQSVFSVLMSVKNSGGSSSFNLSPVEIDFWNSTLDVANRNHIVRFNVYKETFNGSSDLIIFKKVKDYTTNNGPAIVLTNIIQNNLADGQTYNYGYADISSKFKNNTVSTTEDTSFTEDLSVNQVSGLEYVITGQTNGVANITGGSTVNFLSSTNFSGVSNAGFSYKIRFGGVDLAEFNYRVDVSAVNDAPVVANAVGNKSAQYGSSFSFSVPSNTFSDVDGNALTYSVNGLPSGITFNTGSTNFTGTPTASGIYPVNLIATDTGGLKATNTFNLDVAKGSLSATADNKIRNYGDANPPFTGGLVGIVNGDGITASRSTTAIPASGIGDYGINVAFVDSNNKLTNYNTTLTPGTLTVNKANLSITSDNKSRTYGSANPALTFTFSGLKNSDPITASGNLNADPMSTIGTYAITLASLTDSSNKLPNYNVTTNNTGVLTVNKANVNVTAENKTKTYAQVNPTFTASYSGFVNGENSSVISGTPGFNTSVITGSPVNNYAITPTVGSLAAVNYSFSFIPGTISVTKAPLDVRASDAVRLYGTSNPTFSYTFEGLINGDTASAVSGTANTSTTAGSTTGIGDYAINISQGGMASANYSFNNFFSGNLHINPASLTVTAGNTSRPYG
ncbi:MAG: MBG domain-containing protein, partial [Nanoarchaeota archaeon]